MCKKSLKKEGRDLEKKDHARNSLQQFYMNVFRL